MPLPLLPTESLQAAQTHVNGLVLMRLNDAQQRLKDYADDVFGTWDDAAYKGATGSCPNVFVARNVSDCVIWLDGTSTIAQAINQAAGYLGRPQDSWTDPVSQTLIDAAAEVLAWVEAQTGPINATYYVGGWSFGGAVASVLPSVAKALGHVDALWSVVTFGAPRVGGPALCRDIRDNSQGARWMVSTDPIPLVPPRVADFPPILALFGIRGCTRAENFLHPWGGVDLLPGGRIEPNNVPAQGVVNFVSGITQWLLSEDNDPANSHWIGNYRAMIQAAMPNRAPDVGVHGAAPEQPQARARRELAERAAGIVANIQVLGQNQGAVPVVIPDGLAFQWYKLGGLYITALGDQTIATSNTKKRARHLANAGNEFLKRLQTQAVVNPVILADQMTQYLGLASTPESGFQPQLNTAFPVN